ncbi:hypothetical protein BABINDRAFT_161728 [Babjeviella inositovora NRRL Y-12698]|uniref:Uncharacterized protein n=1 Tax=Babjeviella inositovora NRRL Y-12698 TaxID=984486 RepID=A0A1E3QQT1_9ASCO|nr:uncharacterized protein BABINDRAFT_161728 [Babjeviella inositovora NRRL Y-12698]ODQ79317.1 hypothetical protein BABINDRAFT_161728 [Babjeviella inositovora NRRL Y-12698]
MGVLSHSLKKAYVLYEEVAYLSKLFATCRTYVTFAPGFLIATSPVEPYGWLPSICDHSILF